MNWQDLVFGIGSVIFLVSLIPSIRNRQCPSLGTSIPTALVLGAFSITYTSLGYYFSAAVALLTSGVWLVLAAQRVLMPEL